MTRKEISKTDYSFLVGRIEKIGNGQGEFMKDTQKKAVELLGAEIPQNVFDATDNRKAFNMWLGSEINPIIDNDGYKEEIRVFGDGYDFFEAKEYSQSVEGIFAAVTTEIKPHIRGKYFVQIADNWREQSVEESFVTLEDAVKIARIMHSKLRKVSRHIYATVKARTIDINKYCFRADHWTTLFEIDNYGNEKIKHRDAAKAVAEIENRTVEEVIGDIGRTTEDYGIYHSTAKEETKMFKYYLKSNRPICGAVPSGYVNAEKFDNAVRVPRKGYVYGVATYDKPLTAKQIVNYDLRPEDDSEIEKVNNYSANCILINCIDDYFVNSDDAAEVEEVNAENDSAVAEIEEDGSSYDCETKIVTITESKIKAAVAEYNSIGKHFDDVMDVAVDESLPNWEREQKKLIRKHYAAECKEKAKFLRNFFAEIGVPKKVLKIKVSYDYSEFMGTVDYFIEISPKTEKIDAEQLEKIADYFENRNTAADVSDFDDFYDDDVLDEDDAEIKIEIMPDDMAEVAEENAEERKTYFIEVYANEFGNNENDAELIAQLEFPNLLAAYDARKTVHEEYADSDFGHLKITDADGTIHFEREKNGIETFCERELISLVQAREEAQKKPLKEKVAGLRTAEKIISEKYLNLCRSLYVKIDGEYYSAVGFDDYVTKFHDIFYCKEGNDYVEDTAAYIELKAIESEWNEIFKKLEYFENIEDKANILKAKIAEQKKSRKPIIDWKATFEDMRISEILDLQKDFKKYLKLGQIDLAENIFAMLKTLCRNYRAAA